MKRFDRARIVSIFITLALFTLPFFLPRFTLGFDVGTTLTVVSILFSILVGFFIAGATTNYFRLQLLISQSNARFVSLYGLARLTSPSQAPKLAEAIDRYMIATLDYDLLNYAEATEDEFRDVIDQTDRLRPEPRGHESLFGNLHGIKTGLFEIHQEIMVATQTVVGGRHWLILVTLAMMISVLSLVLREGELLSTLVASILIVSCYQVLRLLYDIDTNLFLAERLAFKNPQQVFRGIGRLPYYPQYAIERGNVTALPAAYRVGVHQPGSKTHRVRVVRGKGRRK